MLGIKGCGSRWYEGLKLLFSVTLLGIVTL